MAYFLHHKILFNSRISENIVIELYKKDVEADSVTTIRCDFCYKTIDSGNGDKFDTILSSNLTIGIWLNNSVDLTFNDFLVSFHDEWKVILYNDGQIDFIGYLVPSECRCEFLSKPYSLTLTATDGLGFLKQQNLTDVNGNNFTDNNLLIQYIAGALSKTGLDLNIRTYCSIYESSMSDRNQSPDADMFLYAKLNYRSFLDDAINFTNCYEVLEFILKEGFSLYQWYGKWTINRVGEMQGSIGPKNYYTEYNPDGTVNSYGQDFTGAAIIGKNEIIHPVDGNQIILSRFATKSAKHTFNYNVWPELPKNNKFERGTVFEEGEAVDEEDIDNDGDTSEIIGTYKKYTIDDWEQGEVDLFDLPNPSITPLPNKYYRQSIFNEFGVESDRQVIGETFENSFGGGFGNAFWLRSEGIPVRKGGRLRINLSVRSDNNFVNDPGDFSRPIVVYIVKSDGTVAYYMNHMPSGGVPISPCPWKQAVNLGSGLVIIYGGGSSSEWNSLTVDSSPIPFDGTVYAAFVANGPVSNVGDRWHFKDFSIEYFPYVAGGYIPVKGDYWKTEQDKDYKDIIEEDIFMSDSTEKIFKGALLRNDGELTTTTWHRQNVDEQRHYKELINIARYNGSYRRSWQVEGTFGGTMFHPADEPNNRLPLGFHRHFAFKNSPDVAGYYFQLVPPLKIDYGNGRIDAVFVDCYKDGSNDGNETGNTHEFKYLFK